MSISYNGASLNVNSLTFLNHTLGKIPDHFLDDLVARADIVELIDQRVPLKRAGQEYKACCPFHDEKTPSFTVSQQKQFYHCFGCGAHGTSIGFLMNYDNLSFREAVETLAGQVGMVIPEEAQSATKVHREVPSLLEHVAQAQHWYQQQLRQHSNAKDVIQYLKQRGLSGEICATFGVGFAPDLWDGILSHLGKTQQDQTQLAQAGLLIEKDGGGYYDRFRGRVMFPIEDNRGRIVGFGGRIMGDGEPKYLNSPETPLFHKGSELYNLHRARRSIGAKGYGIVVEGYMDVIALAQFGVENAVATLGTATTPTHLQRLFRAAPQILFCFDGDRAGRDAAWRAMRVVLPELQDGRQVSILMLPDGDDPDSLIRKEGQAGFEQRVQQAQPLSDFLFEQLTSQLDMQRLDGRAALSEQAKPLIETMPQGALRELMLKQLNQLVGVNQTLAMAAPPPSRARNASHARQTHEQDKVSTIAMAICLLIQQPELAVDINPTTIDNQHAPKGWPLLQYLMELIQNQAGLKTAQLLERVRQNNLYANHHAYLEKLAARNHMIDTDKENEVFTDCLNKIEQSSHQAVIDQLLFKAGQSALNEVEAQQLKNLLLAQKKVY